MFRVCADKSIQTLLTELNCTTTRIENWISWINTIVGVKKTKQNRCFLLIDREREELFHFRSVSKLAANQSQVSFKAKGQSEIITQHMYLNYISISLIRIPELQRGKSTILTLIKRCEFEVWQVAEQLFTAGCFFELAIWFTGVILEECQGSFQNILHGIILNDHCINTKLNWLLMARCYRQMSHFCAPSA